METEGPASEFGTESTLTAIAATHQWMRDRDVRHVFGNPGSTELGFLAGLEQTAKYVLGLQESLVVAMADGFAQASGRPALLNLHTAAGLGNAMGMLVNARQNRSPLVVTAGQQDMRHLFREPFLSGDLVGIARPLCKWAYEVTRSQDVVPALERAWLLASASPPGPVFVSIPMDLWSGPAETVVPQNMAPLGTPGGLDRVAGALAAARRPAIVVGAVVDRVGGWSDAIVLAEKLGCAVYTSPMAGRIGFPTDHPLYRGMLLPAAPRMRQALSAHDVVVLLGGPAFPTYPYLPGPAKPDSCLAFLVTDDVQEAARAQVEESFLGHVGGALGYLAAAAPDKDLPLPGRATDPEQQQSRAAQSGAAQSGAAQSGAARAETGRSAAGRAEADPVKALMGSAHVLRALARILPQEAVLVDESVSASTLTRAIIPIREPGGYFSAGVGGIGWGMPASIGIKLALPGRPVVCIIGDGSSMYSIQALWTAASLKLPITYVVLDNAQYVILKAYAKAFHPGEEHVPGLDLPGLDLVTIARGMGVDGERVSEPAALDGALERGMAAGKPYMVVVNVDGAVPSLF